MEIDSILRKAKTKATDLTDRFVNSEIGQEINADRLVDGTKKAATKIKGVAEAAKGYVYKGAGIFERQYTQKQGIGGSVRTTIRSGRMLAKGLKFAAKPAINKGKEYYQRVYDYNQSFIETFTTEGKYDESKLSDALLHIAAITEVYGKKAADKLVEFGKKGAAAVYKDYRNWAPTIDELKDRYAGIGTKFKGFIFKQDLEKCLEFHNKSFQKLPREDSTLDLTLSILQDIKTNAITSKEGLLEFYSKAGENKEKVDIVNEYLKEEIQKEKVDIVNECLQEETKNVKVKGYKSQKSGKKKERTRRTKARRRKED